MRPRFFDVTLPMDRDRGVLLERDELLVLASPVYGGRLPVLIRDFYNRLAPGKRPVVAVVVFGNRGYQDALLELYELCVAKGYEVVGAGAFVGEHSYSQVMGKNRPDPADEEEARRFGLAVRQTLLSDHSLSEARLLTTAGRPYRDYLKKFSLALSTSRRCANCLSCVRHCPVGAFINENPRRVNPDKCINCAACLKLCPEGAKFIDDDDFLDDMAALASANLDRKAPTIYLP
jgi:ferredoxin